MTIENRSKIKVKCAQKLSNHGNKSTKKDYYSLVLIYLICCYALLLEKNFKHTHHIGPDVVRKINENISFNLRKF